MLKEQQEAWGLKLNKNMSEITLSESLKQKYPNLRLVKIDGGKVQSFCNVDNSRCLRPGEQEEDYSFNGNYAIRVSTAFSYDGCSKCSRNTK